jgi:hypothetical protein
VRRPVEAVGAIAAEGRSALRLPHADAAVLGGGEQRGGRAGEHQVVHLCGLSRSFLRQQGLFHVYVPLLGVERVWLQSSR